MTGWRNIMAVIVTGWPGVVAIIVAVLFLHYAFGWSLLRAAIGGISIWGALALLLRREIMSKSYYNQGKSLYHREAYAEAETSYRTAIKLNHKHA